MGIGNTSNAMVERARSNLRQAFGLTPQDPIGFSAVGEMGVRADLPFVEGFRDKKEQVEAVLQHATGLHNVKADITPEHRIKGVTFLQTDFEGAMRSIANMSKDEKLSELIESLAKMRDTTHGRPR